MNGICTLCREHQEIIVNRSLHDLPIRLCTPCATFVQSVNTFTDALDVLNELYELASQDLGDPPGSGAARMRRRPPDQRHAPPHFACAHCGEDIGPHRHGYRFYHCKEGRVPILYCAACTDAAAMLEHHPDAIRRMQDAVHDRYSLMFRPVCGVA